MSLTTMQQPQAEMPAAARVWLSRSARAAAKPWSDVSIGITGDFTGFERTNRAPRLLGRAPT
jgi:hypothetical protein